MRVSLGLPRKKYEEECIRWKDNAKIVRDDVGRTSKAHFSCGALCRQHDHHQRIEAWEMVVV